MDRIHIIPLYNILDDIYYMLLRLFIARIKVLLAPVR
jgi:hypothetical protein